MTTIYDFLLALLVRNQLWMSQALITWAWGAVTVINAFASLLKCLTHEHISTRMLQLWFFRTTVNSNIEQVVCERHLPVPSLTVEKLQQCSIISIIKAIHIKPHNFYSQLYTFLYTKSLLKIMHDQLEYLALLLHLKEIKDIYKSIETRKVSSKNHFPLGGIRHVLLCHFLIGIL